MTRSSITHESSPYWHTMVAPLSSNASAKHVHWTLLSTTVPAPPPEPISEALFATMANQHVAITGTLQAKLGVAIATREDALLKREHQHTINTEALQLLDEIPQTPILLSMPRIEPKTAIQNNINMTTRFAGTPPDMHI